MIDLLDRELQQAWAVAGRVSRLQRGLVDRDDIFQEMCLWACTHINRVEEWREEERLGRAKLGTALYRAGQKYAIRERARVTRSETSDHYLYSKATVEELLPEVLDRSTWTDAGSVTESTVKAPSRPAEGNNRLATLIDVHSAYMTLPTEDRRVLHDRFAGTGRTFNELAGDYQSSVTTVRRNVRRAMHRLLDALGGESPWR